MDDDVLMARLLDHVSAAEHRENLVNNGYTVIDNALEDDHARALHDEMLSFEKAGDFQPNQVQFTIPGRSQPIIATKPGIFEIDLHNAEKRKKAPHFDALFNGNAFVTALQPVEATLHSRKLESGTESQQSVRLQPGVNGKTIKLQLNRGGAFPIHYDNPGRPNRRRWTCLVYLNPNWVEGDGGEVVLLPFGENSAGISVAPKFNRLLIFRSDLVLHRVMTATRPRYCFTVWVDAHADDINRDHDVLLKQKHLSLPIPKLVQLMRKSPLQRVISRAVYADTYKESLLMCIHGRDQSQPAEGSPADALAKPGSRYMLAAHQAQVKSLMNNAALSDILLKLKTLVDSRSGSDEGAEQL